MNKKELRDLIHLVITDYFELHEIEEKVSDETVLFGSNSRIDSLAFVNIIVDIENRLKEKNYDISLTSEKAMSRKNSPFKSVLTLIEFIDEMIGI